MFSNFFAVDIRLRFTNYDVGSGLGGVASEGGRWEGGGFKGKMS